MSIMQNNGGFVYNTHLNNKIEEVVTGDGISSVSN